MAFVHRQRQHLAGAAARHHELGFERLGLAEARLAHQLARLVGRVFQHEGRLAEPRAARVDLAQRRLGQPVQQLDDGVAVDREVGRLAQPDVGPRRARQQRGMIVPDVRRHVLLDAHAGLLQARHRVGRRRLDHVDRVGQQRRGAAGILGRADQHQPVGLGHALGIPVALVLHQLGALARHQAGELERAGARRLRRHLVPVLALLLPVAPGWRPGTTASDRERARRPPWSSSRPSCRRSSCSSRPTAGAAAPAPPGADRTAARPC